MASIKPLWRFRDPAGSYDAVIIGGGLHGLAAAYYLARDHGMHNVAVLERSYLGFGGSSRNTEVIRANQRAPEILPFYVESNRLWNELSAELEWNLMVWMKGLVGLAHSDAGLNAMRLRHETQVRMGIENYLLSPEELKKLVPALDIGDKAAIPIAGGYYNPPGGQVRHDAAVWGFAKGCSKLGVHLCPGVEVTGINLEGDKVVGVETTKGPISTPVVHMAPGGWSSDVARMAGIELPVVTLPLQAMVTECVKPFLNHVLVDELYFCYVQQSIKGDLIMGACGPKGLFIDAGWGYFGFKASTACGKNMAELIATGRCPDIVGYLSMDRFYEGRMVPEVYMARS